MDPYEHILYELRDGVAWVTLNRPEKLNAVNARMRAELMDALDTIRGDVKVRTAVITGAGRAFCSGADLVARDIFVDPGSHESMLDMRKNDLRWGWQNLLRMLWECEKPIIAAVNGWALGFGFHLALYCDIQIAAADARFQQIWARRGLPIEAGGAYILPRLLGINRAKELVLMAEPFGAERALELGLVTRVAPAERLMAEAAELAARFAAGPTRVHGIHKRQLQMSLDSTFERSVYDEVNAMAHVRQSTDAREALDAFAERRDPVYTGG